MPADPSVNQRFSSRIGLLLSTLGIAVGTGNIWRFPRIAAQNGGEEGAGALIFAWIIFLLLWSIPLIIAEYYIGSKYRQGVVGSFIKGIGKRFAWMGAFIAFVATAISFFYAVITGWAMYYFFQVLLMPLPSHAEQSAAIWETFQHSLYPFVFHLLAVVTGIVVILKGIRSIEKVNKILIPVLILIIVAAVIRTLLLPGATSGIRYLFTIEWSQLKTPHIWLQALTQNAWDTGAGWGLFLCYATYMQVKHGVVKNAFITGIGNNIISLLMAVMIFGTVFSVMQTGLGYSDVEVLEVMQTSGPAATGLTFIWMPQLFALMPGGKLLAIFFFLGLSFAGFSSLMSMFELSSRSLIDRGISRKKAVIIIGALSYVLGIPSAMSLNILSNQDFVWGLGLILSGIFIAFFTMKQKLGQLSPIASQKKWWEFLLLFFIPPAGIILLCWWFWLAFTEFAPEVWYNPFSGFSPMTVVMQWSIVLIVFYLFNQRLAEIAHR